MTAGLRGRECGGVGLTSRVAAKELGLDGHVGGHRSRYGNVASCMECKVLEPMWTAVPRHAYDLCGLSLE